MEAGSALSMELGCRLPRVTAEVGAGCGPRTHMGPAVHSGHECPCLAGALPLGMHPVCRAHLTAWHRVASLGHGGASCPPAESKLTLRFTTCPPTLGPRVAGCVVWRRDWGDPH